MAAIPTERGAERVRVQLLSVLTWAIIGVASILVALIAKGAIEIDSRYAFTVILGLGSTFFFSLGLLVLGSSRARRTRRKDEPKPRRLIDQHLDFLVSLLNVSRAVSKGGSLLELGQVIVDSCRDGFECDEVSLMFVEPGGNELSVVAFAGHRDVSHVRNARVKLGEGVAGTVARTRTPLILGADPDTSRFPGFQTKTRKIHSAMVAPIVVRNQVIGVLNASTSDADTVYSDDDLRILCILAEHAGIVAAKARDTDRVVRLMRRMRKRHQQRLQEAALEERKAA